MPVEIRELHIKINVEEELDSSQLLESLIESAREVSEEKIKSAVIERVLQTLVHEN